MMSFCLPRCRRVLGGKVRFLIWCVCLATALGAAATTAHALDATLAAFSTRPDATGRVRVAVHLSGSVTNDAFERLFGNDGASDSNRSARGLLDPDRWARNSIIYLDSPGGNVDQAMRIGREFRRRGFWTAVRPEESCASACVPMMMGGARRWLEVGAVLVIHKPAIATGAPADPVARDRLLDELKVRLLALSDELQVDRALIDRMFETPFEQPRRLREGEVAMWGLATDFGDPFGPFLFTEPVAFPKEIARK
jgi:hypothetical protein